MPIKNENGAPPRWLRRLNVGAAYGMLVLALAAIFAMLGSDFVPSPLTVASARMLAVAVGVFYAGFFAGVGGFGWRSRDPATLAGTSSHPLLRTGWFRVPFMSAVFFGAAWMSFASTFPYLINRLVGTDGTMTVVIGGWQARSSGRSGTQCARPTLEGVPPFMLGRAALCVPPSAGEVRFPRGRRMVLTGRTSPLGISADHFRVLGP